MILGAFVGSLCWQVPGGACEPDRDETILDSVAREVLEETGLHVRHVHRLVDSVHFVIDTPGDQYNHRWRKLTFEVEVEKVSDSSGQDLLLSIDPSVELDPNEHQDWGWVTEEEIKKNTWKKGMLKFMGVQRQTIVDAFATAKSNLS